MCLMGFRPPRLRITSGELAPVQNSLGGGVLGKEECGFVVAGVVARWYLARSKGSEPKQSTEW